MCVCVCVCVAGLGGLLSLIKVLFVFLLIGNTLGLGRALTGLGSGVWEADRGSCSLGVSPLVLPLLSSEVPSARGATRGGGVAPEKCPAAG